VGNLFLEETNFGQEFYHCRVFDGHLKKFVFEETNFGQEFYECKAFDGQLWSRILSL